MEKRSISPLRWLEPAPVDVSIEIPEISVSVSTEIPESTAEADQAETEMRIDELDDLQAGLDSAADCPCQ